jgi:hypothetical protein
LQTRLPPESFHAAFESTDRRFFITLTCTSSEEVFPQNHAVPFCVRRRSPRPNGPVDLRGSSADDPRLYAHQAPRSVLLDHSLHMVCLSPACHFIHRSRRWLKHFPIINRETTCNPTYGPNILTKLSGDRFSSATPTSTYHIDQQPCHSSTCTTQRHESQYLDH